MLKILPKIYHLSNIHLKYNLKKMKLQKKKKIPNIFQTESDIQGIRCIGSPSTS